MYTETHLNWTYLYTGFLSMLNMVCGFKSVFYFYINYPFKPESTLIRKGVRFRGFYTTYSTYLILTLNDSRSKVDDKKPIKVNFLTQMKLFYLL